MDFNPNAAPYWTGPSASYFEPDWVSDETDYESRLADAEEFVAESPDHISDFICARTSPMFGDKDDAAEAQKALDEAFKDPDTLADADATLCVCCVVAAGRYGRTDVMHAAAQRLHALHMVYAQGQIEEMANRD